MSDELDKIEARIKRAVETANLLSELISSYSTEDYLISSSVTEDKKTIEFHGNWDASGKLTRAAVLFSEILHQVSTSLDNIVYHICDKHPEMKDMERDKIYFPICDSQDKWQRNRSVKIFKKYATEKEYLLLRWFQPFMNNAGWDDSDLQPLKVLRDLINIDKHRTLHIVQSSMDNVKLKFTAELYDESDYFEEPKITFYTDGFLGKGKFCDVQFRSPLRKIDVRFEVRGKLHVSNYNFLIEKIAEELITTGSTILYGFRNIYNQDITIDSEKFFEPE